MGGANPKSKDNIKLITQARHFGGGPFADLRKTALKPKNCAKVCAEMGIQTASAQMPAAWKNSAHWKSMARKYAKGYIFFVFFRILTGHLTVYGV